MSDSEAHPQPATTSPKKTPPRPDAKAGLRNALLRSLVLPVLVLVFYSAAPYWLNYRVCSSVLGSIQASSSLSSFQKAQRTEVFSKLDFQKVCLDPTPEYQALHEALAKAGVVGNFQRLRWGLLCSIGLLGIMGLTVAAMFALNARARQSPGALIRSFSLSWKIGMAAALAKIVLLIPLLTYGIFELTVLATDHYYPQALIMIALCGILGLCRSVQILLKKVPLEFKEPLSRAVTAEEAPELWQSVRQAAERMATSPPDRIIIGMQLNFYVTELAVLTDSGRAEGKTLYLSYPLLKHLSVEEVLAGIGHELGHFIGEDTRTTREFYPLRLKARATMMAMAQAGLVGWPSCQLLNFFGWCFGETEKNVSRTRELLADKRAAALTSPQTIARALVKLHILSEAFRRGWADVLRNPAENPVEMPLLPIVREKLLPQAEFWTQLFEQALPHPLDSHPPLRMRVEALGQVIGVEQAQAIAVEQIESAYAAWFSGRDDLFKALTQQAEAAANKIRSKARVAEADYKTPEGKELLDAQFPEKRWKTKPSAFWAPIVVVVIFAVLCGLVVVLANELTLRIVCVGAVVVLGLCGYVAWKRYYRGEFLLNAGGISYTGWVRPLRFQDVHSMAARKQYSTVTIYFRLKEKQPPIWKTSLPGVSKKQVSFTLSALEGNQAKNAQTIFRYLTRQAENPAP